MLTTIVAPATSSRLTTTEAVRDELAITDNLSDRILLGLIDRASSAVAAHCRRTFGVETLADTFRFGWEPGVGPASQTVAPYGTPLNVQRKPLVLSKPGVRAVTSIAENGNALDPATDYETDTGAGLVFRLHAGVRTWWNVPTIVVTYSAGWLLPYDAGRDLPFAVEDACLALVRAGWAARGRDSAVSMDWVEGAGRIQYFDRGGSAMAVDETLADALSPFVLRGA